MRILLVEDDRMIGESVRTSLRQDGYAVDWVQDGRSADAAMSAEHFDLVLLDLGLPGMSGLEVLHSLRGRKNSTPVIVITARDGIEDRIKGLDAGADDYVVKPFDVDELVRFVKRLVPPCSVNLFWFAVSVTIWSDGIERRMSISLRAPTVVAKFPLSPPSSAVVRT